jgi:hypothetical protein
VISRREIRNVPSCYINFSIVIVNTRESVQEVVLLQRSSRCVEGRLFTLWLLSFGRRFAIGVVGHDSMEGKITRRKLLRSVVEKK